jgi:thymidylate kinase
LESLSFFKRVAQGFQKLAAAEPERFVCINGEQDIELIHQEIINILQQRFKLS